jgi:antitoxin ParD1/3/4
MSTVTISLPETVREFIEAQAAEGGYHSASEYVHALVREAQKRKAREKVEALLLEGLNSGEPTPMTPQDWDDLRQDLRDYLAKREAS